MERVKEKQTAWIATLSVLFGSEGKKDETYEYSTWEQENISTITGTNKRIEQLIKATTPLKGSKSKGVVKKVKTTNTTTKTTGKEQYTNYINETENEIEQ